MIMLGKLKPILVQVYNTDPLVIESIRDDPWKVLLAARLLNVTTGRMAIPVFWKVVTRWPTPEDLVHVSGMWPCLARSVSFDQYLFRLLAPFNELVELLRPLGLYSKRAKWLKEISQLYIDDPPRYLATLPPGELSSNAAPLETQARRRTRSLYKYPYTPISHFPGVGPYALDCFRIFCRSSLEPCEEWKQVMPTDKELVRYVQWKWAYQERKIWYSGIGVVGDVDVPYLVKLVDELAEHYDGMIGGGGYMDRFIDDVVSNSSASFDSSC
ncbi:hypothetical protein ID866_7820 [Astraeus odoratus]|nr:hypothetical protein ID866_7820 [Astraeus odoratus]